MSDEETLPHGWRSTSIGEETEESKERVGAGDPPIVLSSTKHRGLVPSDEFFRNRTVYSHDLSNYKTVFKDWFAYATNHLAEGSIGLQESFSRACVSPIYTVFSCRDGVDPNYLYRVLKSPEISSKYKVHEQASVDRRGAVRYRDFSKIYLILPPLEEQQRVAEVLEAADEAIQATERLIAKLEQAKLGLLHDVLTRGSTNWLLSNVGLEFDIQAGITLGPHRVPRNHSKPYLRVANVQRDHIDASDIAYLEASLSESSNYALAPGDLLVVEGHANPWEIGRCAMAGQAQAGLLYQNHLFRLRARRMLPDYSVLWLNSGVAQNYWWRTCATSSGLNTINSRQLKALPIPVPDAWEQAWVVELAASASSRLSAEQRSLKKLYLVKQGLIDDLLTGRVRVGGAHA
jgi:type I restriction enzyme S subunit